MNGHGTRIVVEAVPDDRRPIGSERGPATRGSSFVGTIARRFVGLAVLGLTVALLAAASSGAAAGDGSSPNQQLLPSPSPLKRLPWPLSSRGSSIGRRSRVSKERTIGWSGVVVLPP